MPTHPFDRLPLPGGGALVFTPCPGTKGVELRESLDQLAQAGVKAVITLMPDEEMARNRVAGLPQACVEAGLRWFHLPIEDDTAPADEFRKAWQNDRAAVFAHLDNKEAVAIHCKGGSGRTGLMAAIVMLERGMPPQEVVAEVKALRPRSLKLAVHIDHLANTYDAGIDGLLRDSGDA